MTGIIASAYVLGILFGSLASRSPRFAEIWPTVVRAQMLVAPMVLTVTAIWRIDSVSSVGWSLLMVAIILLMYAMSWFVTTGAQRGPHAVLRAMTSAPNTGYYLVPVAAMVSGPEAVLVAVLMDRLTIPLWSLWIAVLRRNAPIPQSRRTGFVDQASIIAVTLGLALRFTGPAPQWTEALSLWMTPLLAISGAAMFFGSVLHPSQRIDPRPGFRTLGLLLTARIVLFGAIAVLAPTDAIRVVAILCALSAPTFATPQWAAVYGYADPVVAANTRAGWIIGGIGIATVLALF